MAQDAPKNGAMLFEVAASNGGRTHAGGLGQDERCHGGVSSSTCARVFWADRGLLHNMQYNIGPMVLHCVMHARLCLPVTPL